MEWVVYKYGGGVRVFFPTSIQSPIDLINPLDVGLQLNSNCVYHIDDFPGRPLCGPFLPEGKDNTTTFDMNRFSSHARGKKGIAHAQPCHATEGMIDLEINTLTITAQ